MKCGEMSHAEIAVLHLATSTKLDVLDYKNLRGPPLSPPIFNCLLALVRYFISLLGSKTP